MKDIMCERSITYQNDIQRSYMVIKLLSSDEIIDYQVRMIQENPVKQLLPLYKKQIDNDIYIFYDITSKITLNQLLKRIKVNKHEFLSMLKSLIMGLRLGDSYLLQGGSFVLNSDYIYVDPVTFEFSIAYLPIVADLHLNEAIKDWLMDLVIYKIAFKTPDQGEFVYELLNLIKSESFSLNQLDKAIANLALKETIAPLENNSEDMILKSYVQSSTTNSKVKESKYNKMLVFIFLQIFFIATTLMLMRHFYFTSQNPDILNIVGIAIIAIAVDTLWVKKLKLISKPSTQNKAEIKPEEASKVLKGKSKKHKPLKDIRVSNASYGASLEQRSYIDPGNLETKILLEDIDHPPYLLGYGENNKEKIYIDKPNFIIGRIKYQSDYLSGNNAVGKLHAEIINREGSYYLKDLNSRNGTYINGERIVSNVECSIQNNDRISFANSEYRFLWSERAN